MANVGPTTWYCNFGNGSSTGHYAVTAWAASTAQAAGVLRRQLAAPTVGNERVFACIVAGTTLAAEPTWTVTKGAKTAEAAGPTWQECTGQPGINGDLTNCPTWLQNKATVITLGLIIKNAAASFLFICSTAGTTGSGSEPSWTLTAGVTTADNTVTWTCIGAVGNFGIWAAPHARIANANTLNWMAAGDTCLIGSNHAETQGSAINLGAIGTLSSPCLFYCVDQTVAVPPTAVTTGATVTTTGAFGITFDGTASEGQFYDGVTFNCGTGAGVATITVGLSAASPYYLRLDNCKLALVATGSGCKIFLGASGYAAAINLNNTTMSFAATGQGVQFSGGSNIVWRNTASAVLGTVPTTLFNPITSNRHAVIQVIGVDLSAIAGTLVGAAAFAAAGFKFYFFNCKLNSAVTVASAPAAQTQSVDVICSDSAGTNYIFRRHGYEGTETTSIAVVRTGGASDGTTSYSKQIVTNALAKWIDPFEAIPISTRNSTLSTNRVVTVFGVVNATTVPNNDWIWIDVDYLGSSATPQASFATSTKASGLVTATALTADSTSAWDSAATARANTTAYALGDTIKVATNSGRIFFCTTAGTSSGSEPGGYATAIDGGAVTDNTATFRAGCRFSMVATLSSPQPALAGDINVAVKAAQVSTTFLVDPLIVLS